MTDSPLIEEEQKHGHENVQCTSIFAQKLHTFKIHVAVVNGNHLLFEGIKTHSLCIHRQNMFMQQVQCHGIFDGFMLTNFHVKCDFFFFVRNIRSHVKTDTG